MKRLLNIYILFFASFVFCQNNIPFFDGKTFQLDYFLKDNMREEMDLVNPDDPSGNSKLHIPIIIFNFNTDTNQLETYINGFCNGTSAKYKIEPNCLEVLERGGTTLMGCVESEDLDYFFPIKGQIDHTETTDKVFYEFSEDKKGLSIWIDENHKLYFTQKVLSIAENFFEKSIYIYPNPSKEIINIDLKSISIELSEILIIDSQGRVIEKKSSNLKSIDISKLSKGIYFLKIKNTDNISILKKLIKE